jgi:hypothetical protein
VALLIGLDGLITALDPATAAFLLWLSQSLSQVDMDFAIAHSMA